MDYDVVKTYVQSAYKNFNSDGNKFYQSMNKFYEYGKENPSVAKIIMNDRLNKNMLQARQLLTEVASLPTTSFMEPHIFYARGQIYNAAAAVALKSIDSHDLYEKVNNKNGNIFDKDLRYKHEFDESWAAKYPKSGKIRERIIDANRISMDKVKQKAGWFEKINFAKTLGEYQKLYPKTFYARYSLIMHNQISEDGVTSAVSGLFKRFIYKMLIKGKFGFKK